MAVRFMRTSRASARMPRDVEDRLRPAADIQLSKLLCYICRHGAEREGIGYLRGGYVPVWAILSHRHCIRMRKQYTEEDVRRVVATCPLSRFTLKEDAGQLLIRAKWGHTDVQLKSEAIDVIPVLSVEDAPTVIYRASKGAWMKIRSEGLSRMERTCICFDSYLCLPGDARHRGRTCNMMSMNSDVFIFINVKKALDDGYKFYRFTDGGVVCPGNKRGMLPPEYFCEVSGNF